MIRGRRTKHKFSSIGGQTAERRALQAMESRSVHMSKTHNYKKNPGIRSDSTLLSVFLGEIDCKHIFDCLFFSFTFIKSSIYNQDRHSYIIVKLSTYSIQRSCFKKTYHGSPTQEKRRLPSLE